MKLQLTVLISRQAPGCWVAQAIEYDIAAQAKSFDDVTYEFERTLYGQMLIDIENGREPLEDIPPAPERFRKLAIEAPAISSPTPRFKMPVGDRKGRRRFQPKTRLVLCPT